MEKLLKLYNEEPFTYFSKKVSKGDISVKFDFVGVLEDIVVYYKGAVVYFRRTWCIENKEAREKITAVVFQLMQEIKTNHEQEVENKKLENLKIEQEILEL